MEARLHKLPRRAPEQGRQGRHRVALLLGKVCGSAGFVWKGQGMDR